MCPDYPVGCIEPYRINAKGTKCHMFLHKQRDIYKFTEKVVKVMFYHVLYQQLKKHLKHVHFKHFCFERSVATK